MSADPTPVVEEDTSQVLPPPPAKDTIAFLQYSSGSTGMPKGVIITHSNLMENMARFQERSNVGPSSVEISWLPHFHDMGLDLAYLITVFSGCQGYFTSPQIFVRNPALWLVAISRYRGTHTAVPNFAMELVIKRGFPDTLDLGTLECISIGAEPTHYETLEKFYKTFHPFGLKSVYNSIYGLAEHVVLLSARAVEPDVLYVKEDKWVSCGPPLEGITVKVVDPETRELVIQDGAIGEIWATSKEKPRGYWGKPEVSESTFHAQLVPPDGQGYLRTGDLGFLKDGEIYIAGRQKDLIIIHGRNIYPNDVEFYIETKFKNLRPGCSAAFPVESQSGEEIGMVAEILDIQSKTRTELHRLGMAIAQEIALQFEACVSLISMIPPRTIPKTTSGKIRRKQCKKDIESGTMESVYTWTPEKDAHPSSHAPSATTDTTQIQSMSIASIMGKLLGVDLQEDSNFWSLGCNSLKAAEMIQEFQNLFGIEIPVHNLYSCKTPCDVCKMMEDGAIPTSNIPNAVDIASATDTVAVVGMACRYPGANSPEEFWKLLMSKSDTSVTINTTGDSGNVSGCFTSSADVFDYNWFGMSEEKAIRLDPNHSLLLHTVNSALVNSGYNVTSPLTKPVGVFIGISGHEHAIKEGLARSQYSMETLPTAMAANMISYHFGLTGPSCTVDTTCSSSLTALTMASNSLKLGECEAAIVAAVNIMLIPEVTKMNKLATGVKCKPFDTNGQGYVRGEGCGAIVLKLTTKARRDGNRLLCNVLSCVANNSGHSSAMFTVPSTTSEVDLLHQGLKASFLKPSDVAFIEAHAVGNPIADIIEAESISTVYSKEDNGKIYVTSTKGNIGHLEAAAGMAGLMKVILSLEHSTLPPTINVESPHPMLPPSIAVPTEQVQLVQSRSAEGTSRLLSGGITTFSLGGSGAHALVQQAGALPNMKRTTVGVIVALETVTPPRTVMFENAFRELRVLCEFLDAENEVYSKIVTFYGQKILPKLDSIHPVLLEFIFIHSVLRTLVANGITFSFISAIGPLSEVLAAVHANVLSLRDGIAVILSKTNPDLQAEEFKRSVYSQPPTVPFFSPSHHLLFGSGEMSTMYTSTLMKAVWEQPDIQVSMEDILLVTSHLKPAVTIIAGSNKNYMTETGVHVFSLANVPTVHRLRHALLEIRYDHDSQMNLTQRGPSETTLMPRIYERFPLRQAIKSALQGSNEFPQMSPSSPMPCPRRRSSSIYSDLATKILASSSSESSNNSITDVTLNMSKHERLLFLTELVCITAQEVLDLDVLNMSISEKQDLGELGMSKEATGEFLDLLLKRTGVKLTLNSMNNVTPASLSEMILKQMYPGVSERHKDEGFHGRSGGNWSDTIKASLYEYLRNKYPNLPPIEETVNQNVFALGIESLVLTQVCAHIQDVYHFQVTMSQMAELGTLEAVAATIANQMEEKQVSVYPKLSKDDYSLSPPMPKLLQMNPSDLRKVPNFSVTREGVGKIEFIGYSDLTGVNLDETVIIDEGEVTVYPSGMPVPPHGCGLNRPAIVTFKSIRPRKNTFEGYDRMERRLKKNCEEKKLTFIAYDFASGDFMFKVNGF